MTGDSSLGKDNGDDGPSQEEIVKERLEPHRDTLERLADMDVPASKDAKRALELLNCAKEGGHS